jgi:NAD(P)-dependent dehydrogenase (short-subunit alcohol dehydrogenase family)
MAGRLENKVAIVTGAASGIGRAVAVLFVREGAKVVFAGQLEQNGLELERELRAAGGEALFVRTDVTKTEDLQYLVNAAAERYGRIDILVNNAGSVSTDASAEFDIVRNYEEVFNINVKSCLILCREVLPYMIRQQSGSIINTSSVVAEAGALGLASHTASKGAVRSFTRSLASEYADQGVRVNCILPGVTLTDVAADSELARKAVAAVPMGRAAMPEEIACGFLFFASDESSFCTGASLAMDGGMTAM